MYDVDRKISYYGQAEKIPKSTCSFKEVYIYYVFSPVFHNFI